MECRRLRLLTPALGLLTSANLFATDFHFSGFATAAGGKTLDSETVYVVDPTTQGAYNNDFRFEPESMMGLQVQALISNELRATLQLVAKGGDDFSAKADWAFITYDITPKLSVNAGRYRLPTFYYSESLDVGYSYYWIRPPVEVYRIFTATLDGVNLYYSSFFGSMEIITQAWFGSNETDFVSPHPITGDVAINADTTRNLGLNTTLGWDWLKLRLVYNVGDITVTATPPPASGAPIQVVDSNITFLGAALMSDLGAFKWRSEYTQSDNEGDDSSRSWYASAAYSLGALTPHFTHAVEKAREPPFDFNRTTNTLGVAWYFTRSAVIKFEYAKSKRDTAIESSDLELVSTAVDIVF